MSQITNLLEFESRYPKLYGILANGVPVYASLRDGVNFKLNGKGADNVSSKEQGRVSFRRIIDSFIKLKKFKNSKTAVFTSSIYRRDSGRNLAAEFLIDKYPETVIFEWPSRNESFDFAYLKDKLKSRYCPLEYYVIYNKIYIKLHKKEYLRLCEECREKLEDIFRETDESVSDSYVSAIEYLKEVMPDSYATNIMNQRVFKKLFKNYKQLEYAIDFWGSARENIIPVLPSKPQSIELQHGLINSAHPGYIYPKFVADLDYNFFKRTILVYGEKTKNMLCDLSIFEPQQLEVVGNPRIKKYKEEINLDATEKKLILFASQTYEQDGTGSNYYSTVIPVLQKIANLIETDVRFSSYKLGVKLHPRENNSIVEMYQKALPNAQVFGNTSQLYELLASSYIQLTVSSTTLFEAAEFGTPTVLVSYGGVKDIDMFGFSVKTIENEISVYDELVPLLENNKYSEYLSYLVDNTNKNL